MYKPPRVLLPLLCLLVIFAPPALAQSAPAVPTGLSIEDASTGVASWTASTGATSYSVELQIGWEGTTVTLTLGNVTSVDFTSHAQATNCCVNMESYRVRVRASNANGDSAWSDWSYWGFTGTSSIDADLTPYTLSFKWVVRYDLNRVFLSPKQNKNGAVSCSVNGSIVNCPTSVNSFDIVSYPATYVIYVYGTSSGGQTARTETVVLYIPADPGPAVGLTAPDNLRVDSARDTVSWDAVTGAAQYSLRIIQGGSEIVNQSTTSDSVDLSSPISDATATVKVKACYDTALTICGVDAVYQLSAVPVPREGGSGGSGSSGSSGGGNSSESADAAPTRDPANLPIPTQDHSRLPAGAEVNSDRPWIQFREVWGAGIGQQSVLDAGARQAIDIWSPSGVNSEVCFAAVGSLLLLDAAYSPRLQVPLESYRRADGKTCAHLYRDGTVVLMPGQPTHNVPPTATPAPALAANAAPAATPAASQPLYGCMVTTQDMLRFRDAPAGAPLEYIDPWGRREIGWLPSTVTLTALERTADWFMVDYYGTRGWVSAHYVTTSANCG